MQRKRHASTILAHEFGVHSNLRFMCNKLCTPSHEPQLKCTPALINQRSRRSARACGSVQTENIFIDTLTMHV